jgi:hypothetical protein
LGIAGAKTAIPQLRDRCYSAEANNERDPAAAGPLLQRGIDSI